MRVLVVEDDQALGGFLLKGLRLEGHEAELVTDGEAAMVQAMMSRPDMMVLDLGLPRRDGMDVLHRMRTEMGDVSVLVLTGRVSLQDRIDCLNAGADDFMLKPFSFLELAARVKAVHRRTTSSSTATAVLRFGEVELNRMERRSTFQGDAVDLTVKEFALLEYLMLHRGRIVSRAELLREVWSMAPDAGTNVVDVYINYLRKKLGGKGADSTCPIETVRGEGYVVGYLPSKKSTIRVKETLRIQYA